MGTEVLVSLPKRGDSHRRGWWVVFGVAMATPASANGAMGLGLEQWDLTYWYAYVIATLLMEAWVIGRWIGFTPIGAVGVSLVANLITGGLCGGLGLFAPIFHMSFAGSSLNPNPLMNAVALLAAFALPSALIESAIWDLCARRTHKEKEKVRRILGVTFVAHLIGIPLALAILLVPERPYPGLESVTRWRRNMAVRALGRSGGALASCIADSQKVPDLNSLEAFGRLVFPANSTEGQDSWSALYEPEFRRFDQGEAKRRPWETNRLISGMKVGDGTGAESTLKWLIRSPNTVWPSGLVIDLVSGEVRFTLKAEELGR